MKTRLICFSACIAFSFLIAGCGGKKDTADAQTAENEVSAPSDLPSRLPINDIPLDAVEKMAKMIEADPNWLQQIKDKAAVGNVPLVFQLKDDARFFLFEHQAEYGLLSIPEEIVQAEISKIKADPTWLANIEQQAKERGISLEESLRKNALFMIDQRLK